MSFVSFTVLRLLFGASLPTALLIIGRLDYLSMGNYRRGRIYRVGRSSGRSSSIRVGRPSISARTGRAEIRLISISIIKIQSIAHLKKSGEHCCPPYQTHLSPLQPLTRVRVLGVGEVQIHRLHLRTAAPTAAHKTGKWGRCERCPPPSRSHHPTEDSDDSPPLGWLDEAGSPSPSVFVLPVPGLPELRRSPLSA